MTFSTGTSPGAPDPYKITIDSKTYQIAQNASNQRLFQTASVGQDLKEDFDFTQLSWGMGESTKQTENGYYFSENLDLTNRGLRVSPKVNVVAMTDTVGAAGRFFEAADSGGTTYTYFARQATASITQLIVSKVRQLDGVVRNTRTFTVTGGDVVAQGAVRFNNLIFMATDTGVADVQCIMRLSTVQTDTSNDDWTAVHNTALNGVRGLFVVEQLEGNTAKLGRVTSRNKVQVVVTATTTDPLVEANWEETGQVGSSSSVVSDFSPGAPLTLIATEDNLYAWDPAGNTYPIIPFIQQSVVPSSSPAANVIPYGATTIFAHITAFHSALWRAIDNSRAKPIGVEQIKNFRDVPNITAPNNLIYGKGASSGDWLYIPYNLNPSYYLLAFQFRQHPANGLEVIWHTLLKRSFPIHSLFVDRRNQLNWSELGGSQTAYIALAKDGSPDVATNRGNDSDVDEWYGPDLDFGFPEVVKQARYVFVEVEGGNANQSWQFKIHLDGGAVASIGSAITTAATTNINWTVGTNDTFVRLRPRWTATMGTLGSTNDAKILRFVIYARTPDTQRVVLVTDDQSRRSLYDMAKILRKLKDAGPVAVFEPGTNESTNCYIQSVDIVQEAGVGEALALTYWRWAVAA